jgi:uncharacterized RmlC-like cupin family protein
MKPSPEVKLGRVVRGSQPYLSKQGSVYTPGISAETVGAEVLFLGLVTLRPESGPRRISTSGTNRRSIC